jgi:hypothetical protein
VQGKQSIRYEKKKAEISKGERKKEKEKEKKKERICAT